ncbi:MAG: alpha/beta hydrolase [Pseudomonadota bacterium]
MQNLSGIEPATEPETFKRTVSGGVRVMARRYAAEGGNAGRRTAVCLAGLTRNGRDFDVLARALSTGPDARNVLTIDMRGRGGSDFDSDWRNYTIQTETADLIDVLTSEELDHVALIGTSRGGLIAMALAAIQPTRLGVVVLNDIGPIIEIDGLSRIAGYVGKMPAPDTWEEAASLCRRMAERDFPNVTDDGWDRIARQWFNDEGGRPVPGYDPAIAQTFAMTKDGIPELWPQFTGLTRVPCLAIRGGRSDLLSEATVREMAQRHPHFRAHTVADEGHAPLLKDAQTLAVIAQFLRDTDDDQRA